MSYHDAVNDACEHAAGYTRRPNGELDKQTHILAALAHLQTVSPPDYREFRDDAELRYFKYLRDQWLRSDGGVRVLASGKSVPGRRWVQLVMIPGIPCVERVAMTREQLQAHDQYHTKLSDAHDLEAQWAREKLGLMDAAGASAPDAAVLPFLTSEEIAAWS